VDVSGQVLRWRQQRKIIINRRWWRVNSMHMGDEKRASNSGPCNVANTTSSSSRRTCIICQCSNGCDSSSSSTNTTTSATDGNLTTCRVCCRSCRLTVLKDCHGFRVFREKGMLLDCVAMYVVCTGCAGSAWQHSAEPPMAILELRNLWSVRSSWKGVNKNNMKLKL
jgi:hypothetical protein